jgi:integrase
VIRSQDVMSAELYPLAQANAFADVLDDVASPEKVDALKAVRVEGGYVLPRMTLPSLSRAFVRDAQRARLGGSLHSLRHTYISHLVRDTEVPMRTVQLYAGHAHISTTEGYLYLRDTRTHAKVRELAL